MDARLNRDEAGHTGRKSVKSFRVTQQEIVFAVFALLFLFCSLFLKGFLTSENILTLLQNVSVLGILGLAMAIVVIGGGYGGVNVAKALDEVADVTLFEPKDAFLVGLVVSKSLDV